MREIPSSILHHLDEFDLEIFDHRSIHLDHLGGAHKGHVAHLFPVRLFSSCRQVGSYRFSDSGARKERCDNPPWRVRGGRRWDNVRENSALIISRLGNPTAAGSVPR